MDTTPPPVSDNEADMRRAQDRAHVDTGHYHTARGYMDDALTHAKALIERRQRESGE